MALKNNTWKLNQWYDQDVAGNVSYNGAKELWGWGAGENGAFGLNNRTSYSSPIQIPGATWNFPPSGNTHTAATSIFTKTDGTLWSWGYNNNGVLGQNEGYPSPRHSRSSPVQLPGTNWDHVAVGRANVLALKTDGTLWTWGNNETGVLGLNQAANNVRYSSPVQIPGDWSNAKIYNSNTRCSAIKSDGTLWNWGVNSYGQLGVNDQASRSSPVQIPGTTWARCSSGSPHSMIATKTDGTLWAWGSNGYIGQLGLNDRAARSSPTQIPGTTWDYTADYKIAFGEYFPLAIKTDGTLWSWGYNNFGALGVNNRTQYSSPVQVPGTNWNLVSNSYGRYALAIKTDGTLWNWGGAGAWMGGAYYADNPSQSAQYSSPVQVPGTWGNVLATRRNVFIQKVM